MAERGGSRAHSRLRLFNFYLARYNTFPCGIKNSFIVDMQTPIQKRVKKTINYLTTPPYETSESTCNHWILKKSKRKTHTKRKTKDRLNKTLTIVAPVEHKTTKQRQKLFTIPTRWWGGKSKPD